jgi:hypothetical protein
MLFDYLLALLSPIALDDLLSDHVLIVAAALRAWSTLPCSSDKPSISDTEIQMSIATVYLTESINQMIIWINTPRYDSQRSHSPQHDQDTSAGASMHNRCAQRNIRRDCVKNEWCDCERFE